MSTATQMEIGLIRLLMGDRFSEESASGYFDEEGDIHTTWGDRLETLPGGYRVFLVRDEGSDEEWFFTRSPLGLIEAINKLLG